MSDEYIRELDNPTPDSFDEKTVAALNYARAWALFDGIEPAPDIVEAFEKHYTQTERDDIMAVVKTMDFFNRTNNSYAKPLDREKLFR